MGIWIRKFSVWNHLKDTLQQDTESGLIFTKKLVWVFWRNDCTRGIDKQTCEATTVFRVHGN